MAAYEALSQVYDELMQDTDPAAWADYVLALLRERGVSRGRVLDLACGTGAVTLPLARAGYDVVALDQSEGMLEVAADKAAQAAVQVRLLQGDMRDFGLHHPVQAIVCACDGFNYLASLADVERCLAACYRNLVPGGALLFDVSSAHKLQGMDGGFYGEEWEDGAYLWFNRLDAESQCLTMELTFFLEREDGLFERREEVHVQRAHKQAELEAALRRAGFTDCACYGFGSHAAPGAQEQRLRFVARRP